MSDNKTGRTFFDYAHDHPYISGIIAILLISIIMYLLTHNYSITTSGITPPFVKDTSTAKKSDSLNKGNLIKQSIKVKENSGEINWNKETNFYNSEQKKDR